MSIAELKSQAAQLSAAEKMELAAYLRELADPEQVARRARVDELMAEMDAGKKFSPADFERIDRGLTAKNL